MSDPGSARSEADRHGALAVAPWHEPSVRDAIQAIVWWALCYLQREGAAVLAIDPVAGICQSHAAYLATPDSGELEPDQ